MHNFVARASGTTSGRLASPERNGPVVSGRPASIERRSPLTAGGPAERWVDQSAANRQTGIAAGRGMAVVYLMLAYEWLSPV